MFCSSFLEPICFWPWKWPMSNVSHEEIYDLQKMTYIYLYTLYISYIYIYGGGWNIYCLMSCDLILQSLSQASKFWDILLKVSMINFLHLFDHHISLVMPIADEPLLMPCIDVLHKYAIYMYFVHFQVPFLSSQAPWSPGQLWQEAWHITSIYLGFASRWRHKWVVEPPICKIFGRVKLDHFLGKNAKKKMFHYWPPIGI